MIYQYLSIVSSILVVIGYIPELYNLCNCLCLNKSYNEYSNKLIWMIWIGASSFGLSYGICINDNYLIINYGVNTLLNSSIFILRMYAFRKPLLEQNIKEVIVNS